MVAPLDITGQRFGKLVAVCRAGNYKSGAARWLLQCDCGGETYAHTGELRAGKRSGCRSCPRTTHGFKGTRLYRVWESMKQRCKSPKHPGYHRYGGRGISVCEEWQRFEPFAAWALTHGYRDDLQLDRANNDGGYSPDNCRFVTASENQQNRSCSRR